MSICRALDMSLVDLLCDEETVEPAAQIDCLTNENYMIEFVSSIRCREQEENNQLY